MGLIIFLYPIAEIMAFYYLIQATSFWDAILFVMTSGLLGAAIMWTQGRGVLIQMQVQMAQGKAPSNLILHRGLVMLGGLLIFLPGLISDAIGVLLVLPGTRHLIVWYFKLALAKGILKKGFGGRVHVFTGNFGRGFGGKFDSAGSSDFQANPGSQQNIEREAEVVDVTPIEITHENKPRDN